MADEVPDTKSPFAKERRGMKKRGARGKLRRAQEIGHVTVEDTFTFKLPDHVAAGSEQDRKVSEGCYISTTIQNRRYYGILIDQTSLKRASLLHFQDEASGLDLNRKMEYLVRKQQLESGGAVVAVASTAAAADDWNDLKRPADQANELQANVPAKRRRTSQPVQAALPNDDDEQPLIQKFRYVMPTQSTAYQPADPGYRILLATYANAAAAAAEPATEAEIEAACQAGGNFVGDYYYQYEVKSSALKIVDTTAKADDSRTMRMSMGFQSFVQTTPLPDWFPLTNLQVGQQKVLSLLHMKKDSSGNLVRDESATAFLETTFHAADADRIPMEPRSRYRVCVVGGGIAGLSCCLELFRICERERMDVEVVLLEGRSRLGGRLWTDRDTFQNGTDPFPVDLGASWIHGITMNPLADLAREAGAEFVTTSEDVKMFEAGMVEVDSTKDKNASQLFDTLLDLAAHDCWSVDDGSKKRKNQAVIRWYGSDLGSTSDGDVRLPLPSSPPAHRQSNDVSVDVALGTAILKHKVPAFALMSDEERNMLTWNTKNVEYALGANIKDVSMKFWDIDERHAFEGDHVLLKDGYGSIVEHMHKQLQQHGDRFTAHVGFPVGKIEYNRKTTTQTYNDLQARSRKLVELSDNCCVTSQYGTQSIPCDFVVSAVPLGVLKMSLQEEFASIDFQPPLPFLKRDAIQAVGFGLLNKVYLQFPTSFWRIPGVLEPHQTQFGNASGVNPHHYMFLDIGRTLGTSEESAPAILMSLISGREAAICEQLKEEAVVMEVMETLRALFSNVDVPEPTTFKVTRWGTDQFSRGSYTYLCPGTTDDDFEALQSPINGNGDSLLLEGSETMRLFFAGEHTTALYPSMAHGAQLSGVRAAKEIADAMILNFNAEEYDRLLPISMFRYMNPNKELRCSMCRRVGTSLREGKLLAFRKGSRQLLCHANCAENSPEVEEFEGKWKGVFTAVNRSRVQQCSACRLPGATILCSHENCKRVYHFSCSEDTGWRFDVDGKEFYCDLHRTSDRNDSCRVSLAYFKSKERNVEKWACALCRLTGSDDTCGELLAFQRYPGGQEELTAVHENCIKYTTIMDVGESDPSRLDKDFRNVFSVIGNAKVCSLCGKHGATIGFNSKCYHFSCAKKSGWKLGKRGPTFIHTDEQIDPIPTKAPPITLNAAGSSSTEPREAHEVVVICSDDESEPQFEEADDESNDAATLPADIPLAVITSSSRVEGNRRGFVRLGRLSRATVQDRWNVDLYATCTEGSIARVLRVAASTPDPFDQFEDGDVVKAINGRQVGSPELDSLQKVFTFLSQEVEAMVEVRRFHRAPGQWY